MIDPIYVHNNPRTYNENQGCACGYCVRREGFCHCMGEDPTCNLSSCGCIGIACNHKKISRIKIHNITSALGGMGHGIVDFVIGSLHDLQTAAVYMGSAELEMSLYERSAMIEAVEQSQIQQLETMGSHFMGMLSIDASDAFYQSFRSKTTLGLEMGSLVTGAYGAIKGVIAFNRLARAPVQVTKLAGSRIINKNIKANPIWSSTKKRTSAQNAYRHWKDHGHEFPSLQNSKQYVEATRDFTRNSPVGTLTKTRSNGDIIFYDPSSNVFAITNQNGLPRTMYKPAPSIHSYLTNLEYFYAQ